MHQKPLGKTGFNVAPLGFGSAEIGYLNTERKAASDMLNYLLDHGVNLIDTAASYKTSEEVIGEAISHRRGEFVLVSKCGGSIESIDAPAWSAELITRTVERALKRLRTDHLDVMLLHSCDEATLKKGDALAALVAAQKAGKIRFAGYSGDNETAAYAAGLPDISVIETSISIADQNNIDVVLPIAAKNNLGVLAKRPIANAAWKDVESQEGIYRNYSKPYVERLKKMQLSPESLGIKGPNAIAWPELALHFTLSQPAVTAAIVGSSKLKNIQQNLEAAAKGPLPKETVAKIREAFKSSQGSDSWHGLT